MKKLIYINGVNDETKEVVMSDLEAVKAQEDICSKCPLGDKHCSLYCSASPYWDGQPLGVDPKISVVDC
jgi:hypothetical protein